MQLEDGLALAIVLITTLLAYGAGRKLWDMPASLFSGALRGVMECIGAAIICFGLNAALAFTVALAFRFFTTRFVPFYMIRGLMLVILSLFQGVLFVLWRRSE